MFDLKKFECTEPPRSPHPPSPPPTPNNRPKIFGSATATGLGQQIMLTYFTHICELNKPGSLCIS